MEASNSAFNVGLKEPLLVTAYKNILERQFEEHAAAASANTEVQSSFLDMVEQQKT